MERNINLMERSKKPKNNAPSNKDGLNDISKEVVNDNTRYGTTNDFKPTKK